MERLKSSFVHSVQAGASHSLALTDKAELYSWGKNSQGQCGVGNNEDLLLPALVSFKEEVKVVVVAAGWEHTLALTSEGEVYSWGCGYKDSRRGVVPPVLGLGSSDAKVVPEKIMALEGITIRSIVCGWDHCLALSNKVGSCYRVFSPLHRSFIM